MAIPDFQSILLPALKLAGHGEVLSTKEAIEGIAKLMNLDEADRQEVLPSGRQRRLDNRVNWAFAYLRQARLLDSAGRRKVVIT